MDTGEVIVKKAEILYIDENSHDRDWISSILDDIGYIVTSAINGSDGLRIFSRNKIDIVITDIKMPPPDGLEILSKIKNKCAETPVILLSDQGGVEDTISAIRLGAYEYLTKKDILREPGRLIAAINRAWEKLKLTTENEAYKNGLESMVEERTFELASMRQMMAKLTENAEKLKSEAFRKIQYSEKKYKTLMAKAPSGIATISTDGHITALNGSFVDVLGFQSEDELKGQSIFENKVFFKSGFTDKIVACSLRREEYCDDQPYCGPDNKQRFIEYTLTLIQFDDYGFDAEVLFTVKDITLEEQEKKRLANAALYDGLTGLMKHEKFYEKLKERIKYVKEEKKQLAVVHVDLDDFGAVNSKYKHHAASEILKVVGHRIKCVIDKDRDRGFRVGGDEFAIIFSCFKTGSIENIVQRLFNRLSEVYTVHDGDREREIKCTFSVGVSIYSSEQDQTAEKLYKEADDAMYVAKESGKNRFAFFKSENVSLT